MIDTHAHLNSKDLTNLEDEIKRINNLDYLDKVINVGLDEETNKEVLAISTNHKKMYCALGIHPLRVGPVESIAKLCQYSEARERVVAIGETGLDDAGDLKEQKLKFIETIELANFLKLPIIIHGNNTNKIILDILKKYPAHYGFVFHCFQPDMLILEEIIRRDGYISVGKPITYKTAKKSLEVVRNVPMDNLLIELDYPYMSNNPTVDGKAVFRKIQELRGMEYKELEIALDNNAKRLFKGLRN